MSRYFEIIQQDSTTHPERHELPLVVGGSGQAHIRLDGTDRDVCYIGEDHGHLFLQPVPSEIEIFHNNQRISGSVWIKSGDVTRIGGQVIQYDISGDLVTITVEPAGRPAAKPAEALTHQVPPSGGSRPLPRVSAHRQKQRGIPPWVKIAIPLLVVLAATAAFLLAAVSFDIKITPMPDDLSFSAMPPVIEIGGRFLSIPGRYVLHAAKKGYQPLDEEIDIKKGVSGFSFKMELLPGIADFTTEPEQGAEIRVDNTYLGVTPLKQIAVPAGRHSLSVMLQRYKPRETEILVEGKGRHQRFHFILEPAWATVSIMTEPAGARISMDGVDTGRLTPASLEIIEGEHELLFTLGKYSPVSIKINVKAGEQVTLPVTRLTPAPALLEIAATPPGAMIAIDGIYAGKAPFQRKIDSGREHVVTATAPGYSSGTQKVKLGPGESRKLNFNLKGRYGTIFITTEPSSAALFIDGRRQKKNSGRFTLLAVPHTLEVRSEGRDPVTKRVSPIPGISQSVDFRPGTAAAATKGPTAVKQGELVLLQPGRFTMGSSRREQGRRTNEARREIILTRPFYIGAREVTNRQFRLFRKDHSSGSFSGRSLNGDNQPVVNVSWEDAARYCNWLSSKEGLAPFYREENGKISAIMPAGTGYRLPSEAEWAFAARFARRTRPSKYPWNGKFPPIDGSGNFADESARGLIPVIIDGYNDSFAVSAPPASFRPNAAGLFDMGGNVAEWCHDFYSPAPGRGPDKDPLGPARGTHHVVRDSSWQDSSMTQLRLSYRAFSRKPADFIGFRVARYAR